MNAEGCMTTTVGGAVSVRCPPTLEQGSAVVGCADQRTDGGRRELAPMPRQQAPSPHHAGVASASPRPRETAMIIALQRRLRQALPPGHVADFDTLIRKMETPRSSVCSTGGEGSDLDHGQPGVD